MERNATYGKSGKHAQEIANACNDAYYNGLMDSMVGLTLPLIRPAEAHRDALVSVTFPTGTLVNVLSRSGAWFKVQPIIISLEDASRLDKDFTFQVQRTDLRESDS